MEESIRTRKWIRAVLLLFLGLYLFDNMLTGRIYYYINERFGLFSWAAVAILLTMGIVSVVDLLREPRSGADEHHKHKNDDKHDYDDEHEHKHEHGHEHQHGTAPSWLMLGILALPLVLGVLVPAKPLGASAVGSSGVSTSFSGLQSGGTSTQFSVAPQDRNVLDWVRAFNITTNVDEFNGQQGDVIGFVYRDIRFKDSAQFMLSRFTVSCCVADASAIGVIVQAKDAAMIKQDSWVHVKGKFQVQIFDGQRTPILVADSVEVTGQPAHPYLYP
jgi:putative membrane protein